MKGIFILCSFVFSAFFTFGQSATIPAGGDATGTNGSSSFSVGQVVYQMPSAVEGSTNQGVQQPYEISIVVGDEEHALPSAGVATYPNPVQNQFVISIDPAPEKPLKYRVVSSDGKVVSTGHITSTQTTIDSEKWTSGMYVLEIEHSRKAFKILKTK